ncbi:MAG: GGDEF domain-containing protein, partial [Bdellovibrionota bacterium]
MDSDSQSGAFAPLSARRQLPPLQPEDYRQILKTLATVGWVILGLALGLEAWIRSSESLIWPQMDNFSERYNFIAALYAFSNAVLSFLLVWRGWLEAKPRKQRRRLRSLLAAVLLRDAAVLIWFAHLSGSVQGPMAMGLPFLVIAAYMILPREAASAFSALLTAGCVAVVVLERQGVISFPGMLARAFDVQGVSAVPGTIVLLAFVAASFVFGNFARTRLNEAGTMIHRRSILDPLTGLFGREFFEHRLADELDRARRNGRAVSVLVS